jgi:CRISPR system Cascade subunit CasE
MSALYFASVPVDMRAFRRLAALRGFASDEGRATHHLLSEAFGKGSLQPFRMMVAGGERQATLYAYTSLPGDELSENLQCAAPELLTCFGASHLALREMPESWREGRRLAFDLRIRPVRRLMRPLEAWSREENRHTLKGTTGRGPIKVKSEVDAFLVARLRQFPEGPPADGSGGLTREDVYLDWLNERFEGAARLDRSKSRLKRFARRIAERRPLKEQGYWTQTASEGPDATIHGELTVTNSEALCRLLAGGVGRHTAYGYGMLLLRPAGR